MYGQDQSGRRSRRGINCYGVAGTLSWLACATEVRERVRAAVER